MALISLNAVSAGYGTTPVSHDVSCEIEAGEFVAILGPNGCGKTTLISAVLGLQPLLDGTVRIGDIELPPATGTGRKRDALARTLATSVALVSQAHRSTFPFGVLDLVLTGRLPYIGVTSTPKAHDLEIARAALAQLGISRLEQRTYTNLSGGERQMVLLARALAQETDILVLDEPTTYLDIANQEQVLSTARDLVRNHGKTVIAIVHEPNHALAYADKVLLLGKSNPPNSSVLAFGRPETSLTAETMMTAYGLDVGIRDTDLGHVVIPRRTPDSEGSTDG